jgi:hypothetical protein
MIPDRQPRRAAEHEIRCGVSSRDWDLIQKYLELSRHPWTGDQTALEALVRFSDKELKQLQSGLPWRVPRKRLAALHSQIEKHRYKTDPAEISQSLVRFSLQV